MGNTMTEPGPEGATPPRRTLAEIKKALDDGQIGWRLALTDATEVFQAQDLNESEAKRMAGNYLGLTEETPAAAQEPTPAPVVSPPDPEEITRGFQAGRLDRQQATEQLTIYERWVNEHGTEVQRLIAATVIRIAQSNFDLIEQARQNSAEARQTQATAQTAAREAHAAKDPSDLVGGLLEGITFGLYRRKK